MTVERDSFRPIFIIGSPRSGTTMLRLILDAHPHLSSGPETTFLIDMKPIVDAYWKRIHLYGWSKEEWHQHIRTFFDTFQNDYARKRGKQRWVEKTPIYTRHLDFINAVFPNSQMIHLIRDGRAVVNSHLDRWGYRNAVRSVNKWRHHVESARAFGATVSADRYFEIRYEALVLNPEQEVRSLLTFLDEPWDDSVLNFNKNSHDIMDRYAKFTAQRRNEGDDTLVYQSRINKWRKEMPWGLRALCQWRAGALLKELGYE